MTVGSSIAAVSGSSVGTGPKPAPETVPWFETDGVRPVNGSSTSARKRIVKPLPGGSVPRLRGNVGVPATAGDDGGASTGSSRFDSCALTERQVRESAAIGDDIPPEPHVGRCWQPFVLFAATVPRASFDARGRVRALWSLALALVNVFLSRNVNTSIGDRRAATTAFRELARIAAALP